MSAPCYGCGDRQIGCHSSCEKYAAFNRENIRRRKEKAVEFACEDINYFGKMKTVKEKMGRKKYCHGHKL